MVVPDEGGLYRLVCRVITSFEDRPHHVVTGRFFFRSFPREYLQVNNMIYHFYHMRYHDGVNPERQWRRSLPSMAPQPQLFDATLRAMRQRRKDCLQGRGGEGRESLVEHVRAGHAVADGAVHSCENKIGTPET